MNENKILTDIRIFQSETWQRNTKYVGDVALPFALNKIFGMYSTSGFLYALISTFKILFLRKNYNCAINADPKCSQVLAFLRKILSFPNPKQIVLELMLDEEKEDFWWNIKKRMQQFIFSKVEIIFVSSRSEVLTYSERLCLPKGRIRFLPFHTNIVEPRLVRGNGNYFLSAGKTARDFGILIEAVKNLECEVIIVSDHSNVMGLQLPSNVHLLVDIPYPKYLELLFDCQAVIVPLKKVVKSTGQVAFLEAMALGKPVIATETVGTVDYIQSGFNGILVAPDDVDGLKKAILQIMADKDLYQCLSVNALKSVKELHTFEVYVDTILKAAKELAG